jgi:hypothetical protein
VQVVAVEQVRAEGKLPGGVRPGRRVAGSAHARAEVEQAARGRMPWRAPRGGDANEVVDERRYAPVAEPIRSAIASTLGKIASSSVGL